MSKSELIERILGQLREQFDRMLAAAKAAESYATDEGSRAESKYDTRGLEASYLAAGQAAKVEELGLSIERMTNAAFPAFAEDAAIDLGALVEAEVDGDLVFFLVAPAGGGTTLEYLGCPLSVVTPDSPMGERLMGRRAGDELGDGGTIYSVS